MAKESLAYWIKKKQITEAMSTMINSSLIETAMKRVPISWRHWVLKQACGFCAVFTVLKQQGKQSHDRCPHCGEQENAAHVLICQNP
jgi:hypothetical protein